MTLPFHTVGHSNRSLSEFIDLIASAAVTHIVDVRKMPMSRANPQFNGDRLADDLSRVGIGYEHVAALGGLRSKDWQVPPDVNALWRNRSFHNYADYALSPAFGAGLAHLLRVGTDRSCAVMCSEAVWWRCHRRIISDYLIARDQQVFHIMGVGRFDPAVLTPGGVIHADGEITYPADGAER